MRRAMLGMLLAIIIAPLAYVMWWLTGDDAVRQPESKDPKPQPTVAADAGRGAASGAKTAARETPAKDAAAATPSRPQAGDGNAAVKIEVARIDAAGASVIAGRAPAGSQVTVIANGRVLASTVASADGQWSVVVTEGIGAGPLELTAKARLAGTGAVVDGAVARLDVPRGSPTWLAATSAATGTVAAGSATATAKAASGATRGSPDVAARGASGSAADAGSEQRALKRFEAIVEEARKAPAPLAAPSPATAPTTLAASGQATAPVPVPVPITFVTNEATLTPNGERAAQLLAEYLRLKRPTRITLSGHADVRGSDTHNVELSRRRLEAIERYLRAEGYAGRLDLLPRGRSEPFAGIDRVRLSREEVWQADRRVELRIME